MRRLSIAKAFAKNVFINQERRLGDRKRLDTVVVLTVNYADSESVDAHFYTGSTGAVREITSLWVLGGVWSQG